MSELVTPSISVSRDIPAPAPSIFAMLANPAMHPYIDGTGMAQSAHDNVVIDKVGDTFVMNMTHWSLGDYGMENLVVEFAPDRRIVWEPRGHTYQSSQFDEMMKGESPRETRYWGWQLEPLAANLTRVTEFYDATRLSVGLRGFIKDGEFWRKAMVESLLNLERLVTATASGDSPPINVSKLRNYYEEVQQAN